jgi:positive phototaxis protein PixI
MSDALSALDVLSLPDTQNSVPASENASEQFLRLHLALDTTVLLPVQQLAEVLTISTSQVVPISHMPTWVMGVYNWRGEILWMVDLGHLCGLTPWYQQPSNVAMYPAVVLQVSSTATSSVAASSQALGLIVNRVEEIEWCNPNQIQPLSTSTVVSILAPFLRGYWWKSNDQTLAVLDEQQ